MQKFDELMERHRVRPTVLTPLWRVAGFALGAGTALMGREAAMACTVAVETTVGEHYNDQLRTLHAHNMNSSRDQELRQVPSVGFEALLTFWVAYRPRFRTRRSASSGTRSSSIWTSASRTTPRRCVLALRVERECVRACTVRHPCYFSPHASRGAGALVRTADEGNRAQFEGGHLAFHPHLRAHQRAPAKGATKSKAGARSVMSLSLDQTSDGGPWHEQEVRRVPSTHPSPRSGLLLRPLIRSAFFFFFFGCFRCCGAVAASPLGRDHIHVFHLRRDFSLALVPSDPHLKTRP